MGARGHGDESEEHELRSACSGLARDHSTVTIRHLDHASEKSRYGDVSNRNVIATLRIRARDLEERARELEERLERAHVTCVR